MNWRAAEFDVRKRPAESISESLATAKTLLEMLATLLQTPESFSWDLQRCCKRRKVFRETCNGVANTEKFFVRLATVLQTPKSFSWDLQRCCKRQKVLRETCNSVASISKSTLAATTLYRKHPIGIRKSIPSSNIRSGGVSRAKPGVYLRPTTIFDAVTLLLPSLPCIGVHRQEKRARLG